MEEVNQICAESAGRIFIKDPDLLKDIQNYSVSDIPSLAKRLNASICYVKTMFASLEIFNKEDLNFARSLGQCYFLHIDGTKLLKPLEKLLFCLPSPLLSIVKEDLAHILPDLLSGKANTKKLVQLSAFMEQSLTADIVGTSLPRLCDFLMLEIDEIISNPFDEIMPDVFCKLSVITKICLQLFQHHGTALTDTIWMENVSPCSKINKNSVQTIVQMLLLVLSESCFGLDTQLLAGTALAMLLNTAPNPALSVTAFWTIHGALTHGNVLKISVGQFILDYKSTRTDDLVTSLFGKLAFVRGEVVCGLNNILLHQQNSGPSGENIAHTKIDNCFLLQIFPIVCKFCDGPLDLHYQAFQLLSHWFRSLLRAISNSKLQHVMHKDSVILNETMKRVWLNWDSPIDGVAQHTSDTFFYLVKIWNLEVESGISDNAAFAQNLLTKLLKVPWYTRGKYKLLCILLSYEDCEKILTYYPQLKEHLLLCMGSNSLASVASDVYKTLLYQLKHCYKNEEKLIQKWKHLWMDTILKGLLSDEIVVSRKVSEYWVMWTLRIVSGCGLLLQQELSFRFTSCRCLHRQKVILYAWTVVTTTIRSSQCLSFDHLNISMLRAAACNENETVMAAAISVLCATAKTSESVSDTESNVLREALPHCLKIDSAPFRQQLGTNVRLLIIRVRDSCVANLKKKEMEHQVDLSVDLVEWLHGMLIENTTPGINYQRRKTCLELLLVIYESLIYWPTQTRKKGHMDESVHILTEYVRNKGVWDFFSSNNMRFMLHCVLDGANEIQELAVNILMKYYPWPLRADFPLADASIETLASHLLVKAFMLCNSPRPHESQSGAHLCKIVVVKYANELGTVFSKCYDEENHVSFTQRNEDPKHASVKFIKLLCCEITESLNRARSDPSLAAKQFPIHGLMQAVTLCLKEVSIVVSRQDQNWKKILNEILSLNMQIIDMMLSVLSGGLKSEICPSFAEMGAALENLSSEDDVQSPALSPEFQFLLSWCWVNLKTSCTCLGEIVALAVDDAQTEVVLHFTQVAAVGQTFVRVLTHCRHRGAIEGCRSGLLKYCTSLMSTMDKHLSLIPATILQEVLTSLESNVMLSSVTRRSAGLPIIVQIVTQAERHLKQQTLLIHVMKSLLSVASITVPADTDQTRDVSQVHAFNILKVLLEDASLVCRLKSYFSSMIMLVIEAFESPAWAVRNAATQLFSIMVSKLFGQKSKHRNSLNMITFKEFEAHYPELPPFMLQKLDDALCDINCIEKLHPSLFLLLTLLANLGPAQSKQNSSSFESEFKKRILLAVQSPVYSLRELSAKAHCALVPTDSALQVMENLVQQIPVSRQEVTSCNLLHGILLCLEKLVMGQTFPDDHAKCFLEAILQRCWLMECSLSLLVSAKYMQVLRVLLQSIHNQLSDDLYADLSRLLNISHLHVKDLDEKIGKNSFVENMVETTFALMSSNLEELSDFLTRYLKSGLDIKMACLNCILKLPDTDRQLFNSLCQILQEVIWSVIAEQDSTPLVLTALTVITEFGLSSPKTSVCPLTQTEFCCLEQAFQNKASIMAALLPVKAVWMKKMAACTDNSQSDMLLTAIGEWSEKIMVAVGSQQNENFRLAAAQGLVIAGSDVLQFIQTVPQSQTSSAVCLIDSTVTLLEDVDSSIRKMAARFVSKLKWPGRTLQFDDLNCSICFEVIFEYIADNFWWSENIIEYLLQKIHRNGDLLSCLKHRLHAGSDHLFEQENSSFYAETLIRNKEIHKTLKKMLKLAEKYDKLDSLCHAMQHVDLHKELSKCIPVIEQNIKANHVINVTGEQSVVAALSGALLKAHVFILYDILDTSQHPSYRTDSLTHLIKYIVQLNNLHPWIYQLVTTMIPRIDLQP